MLALAIARLLCQRFLDALRRAEDELRAREERQAFLLALSDALRPLVDPLATIATASELVGRHLDAGRCGYGELPPPYDHFVVARDWTRRMPRHRGRWRLSDFGDALASENRAGRTPAIRVEKPSDSFSAWMAATAALYFSGCFARASFSSCVLWGTLGSGLLDLLGSANS